MLNRVILMGRITQDLEIRQTQSGASMLSFTVAVDRNTKQGEERQSDFIRCVAFNQRAEFINKYFAKGRMIAIEGNLKTGSYDDRNGTRHYTTDVWVDSVSFTGEKSQNSGSSSYAPPYSQSVPSNQQPAYKEPASSFEVGNMDDFEEILSDDGVPF